ncbi:MAG TPA: KH domain-containing protein [Bacillota bacterium]|nr:KH domain-containing protein [Bacillota bacterium]HOH10293.1 KH domain-containing protein [Bacillota bacterium]HPI01700.1 KH domain-containing protein [Bacillota bacterium]HPM63892.1 KH domain-containing protein [Bacillota bacterium]HQJ25396.1 KH domain-containing protein [Bacillota bacterium]
MASRKRSRLKDVVEYTVRSLVREPEEVFVKEIWNRDDDLVLKITTAQPDMGKVIGKQGRIAKAVRAIAKAQAVKEDVKVTVDIVER